eukprot:s1629_g14.t1
MDLKSCVDCTNGDPFNMVVACGERIGDHVFGHEIPFGANIVSHYEGQVEEKVTIYNAKWANTRFGDSWLVNLTPGYPPMNHKVVDLGDYSKAHDLCCGLGGFSAALDFVGIQPKSAVDLSLLALSAYGLSLNHSVPTFQSDAGIARCIHPAHHTCFSEAHGFQSVAEGRPLHHTWPARRNRWFAVLVPGHVNLTSFDDLPALSPLPVVHDLMPHYPWPVWSFSDEEQLKWTEMELQAYGNFMGIQNLAIQTDGLTPVHHCQKRCAAGGEQHTAVHVGVGCGA